MSGSWVIPPGRLRLLVFVLFTSACGSATYQAASVGYQIHTPGAWTRATSHDEERLERTAFGVPVDIAATEFRGQNESYLVLGFRGAWRAPSSASAANAFVQGLSQWVGNEGAVDTIRTEQFEQATEVDLHVTRSDMSPRALFLRVHVEEQSVYVLFAVVDLDDADNAYLRRRRQEWMDSFQATPPLSHLEPVAMVDADELGRIAVNALFSGGPSR